MIDVRTLAPGEEIPALAKVVTREDIEAYAYASGDTNPLHLDDEHARRAGFDSVVAHGMFTMAHLATCITNWAGSPEVLAEMRVQFRAVVYPGETLVAGGKVLEADPATGRVVLDVWVTVERNGKSEQPIRKSRAELRFPA